MQVEDPRMPERGSTLDEIMHLHIYFHDLLLTRGTSYIKLLGWISKEKAVVNTKNNDEQYFKWAAFATSHHKTIAQDPQPISEQQHYKDKYNWFSTLAIQKKGKFEKKNHSIVVNLIYNHKEKYGHLADQLYEKHSK